MLDHYVSWYMFASFQHTCLSWLGGTDLVRSIPQLLHRLLHHHDSQRFLNRIDPSIDRKLGLMYTAALRSVALLSGHCQLHRHFWPIGSCLIWLAITNHGAHKVLSISSFKHYKHMSPKQLVLRRWESSRVIETMRYVCCMRWLIAVDMTIKHFHLLNWMCKS